MRAEEVYKIKTKDADGKMVEKELKMLDVVMDASSLAAVGTMVGSAGVMIMDDSADMVWALNNLNQFYANESCGQCTPCREGSLWMSKITTRMLDGAGRGTMPRSSRTSLIISRGVRFAPLAKLARGQRKVSLQNFRRNSRRRRQETAVPLRSEGIPGTRSSSSSLGRRTRLLVKRLAQSGHAVAVNGV